MTTKPFVSLRHVRKDYQSGGNVVNVFEDLNLDVFSKDFVAVLGSTGCGKTTLVNLLTGLDRNFDGSILFDNLNLKNLPEKTLNEIRSKRIGIVFQAHKLLPELTAYENVEVPSAIMGVGKAKRHEFTTTALKSLGIVALGQRKVATLSYGEKRLVCVARAIVNSPEVLVMDEPTESLDPFMADYIIAFCRSANALEGRTVVITTHSRRLAQSARKIFHLRKRTNPDRIDHGANAISGVHLQDPSPLIKP